MKRARLGTALAACVATLGAVSSDYLSVERKFRSIESGQLQTGSRVHLSPRELNAYVEHQLPAVTGGVRQPRLRLIRPGVAEGTALVNFAEIGRSQGHPPGWLMSQLLEGEHPVSVTATIRSASGSATVNLLSVEISGVKIEGETLHFLIQHFLLPLYPNAAVDRPFELGDRIEKLDVQPSGVDVLIGR
ncbi:MAG: hypothetical protein LAP40_18065 [Acidobacteriia bacterium]|nr:hypothetical protein [Terriglobia bacterium]